MEVQSTITGTEYGGFPSPLVLLTIDSPAGPVEVETTYRSGIRRSWLSIALVTDAGCGSLGYAASEIAHLFIGEVVDGEARLLQLVTDIHGC